MPWKCGARKAPGNSERSQNAIMGEVNQMALRINQGFEQLFGMVEEPEYHLRRQCGYAPDPFYSQTRPGHLSRRTPHGYGTPPADIQLCRNRILFDRCAATRNCAICEVERETYGRRQVYNPARATRCYESRKPNGRWDTPTQDQYQGSTTTQLPKKHQSARSGLNTNRNRKSAKPNGAQCVVVLPMRWHIYHGGRDRGTSRRKTPRNNNRVDNFPILPLYICKH